MNARTCGPFLPSGEVGGSGVAGHPAAPTAHAAMRTDAKRKDGHSLARRAATGTLALACANRHFRLVHGVIVTLSARAMPDQSSSPAETWAFEVTVRVNNAGDAPVRITGRRWSIEDADGHVQEIVGTGLAGGQPLLDPGVSLVHTWMCVLRSPRGTVRGGVLLEGDVLAEAKPVELLIIH